MEILETEKVGSKVKYLLTGCLPQKIKNLKPSNEAYLEERLKKIPTFLTIEYGTQIISM